MKRFRDDFESRPGSRPKNVIGNDFESESGNDFRNRFRNDFGNMTGNESKKRNRSVAVPVALPVKRLHAAVVTAVTIAVAFLLLSINAMPVFAADTASLDMDETGSVTLTLADSDGNAVSGGAITLYEVAKLYLDDGNMAYACTEAFQDCEAAADADVTDTSLAKTLAEYALGNGLSGAEAQVGSDGTVTFEDLELGLYLIVQTTASEQYETINPFLVTVPIDNDGIWEYAVNATPKVGTVTPEETEPATTPEETEPATTPEETEPGTTPEPTEPVTTEEPDEPTVTTPEETEPETTTEEVTTESATTTEETTTLEILPQTGQLNWPVPVLAVSGLLCFGFGWALKRTDRNENGI